MTSNTLRPPAESTARAKGESSWIPSGQCLNFVWWCIDGVTSAGYPDANTALADVNELHAGDRNPPPGVPCYWTGSKYGHVALSLGNGLVRSTDYPSKEDVSTVSIDELTAAWGRHYEGWAADYNDTPIPGVEGNEDEDMPSAEDIAAAVWRYDQGGNALQAWAYQRDGAKKVWQYDQDDATPQAWAYQRSIEQIEQDVAKLVATVADLSTNLAATAAQVDTVTDTVQGALLQLAEAVADLAGRPPRPADDEH